FLLTKIQINSEIVARRLIFFVATADGFSCSGQLRTTQAKKKSGFSFTFRSFALPLQPDYG
ncbi:MAG: hypothetical protein II600_00335, partial [Bacteroidaceae bacterium]|nr:hypothetical protein [Bacteroidaceae bacterium]